MSNIVINRVKKVLANILKCQEHEITNNTNRSNLKKWNSMSHIKIILGLEKEFNMRINDDDAMSLISVDAIVDFCSNNKAVEENTNFSG